MTLLSSYHLRCLAQIVSFPSSDICKFFVSHLDLVFQNIILLYHKKELDLAIGVRGLPTTWVDSTLVSTVLTGSKFDKIAKEF